MLAQNNEDPRNLTHTVWKTRVNDSGDTPLMLPQGSKFLTAIGQGNSVVVYYSFPTKNAEGPRVARVIRACYTGDTYNAQDTKFLGIASRQDGKYVSQVFEVTF